MYSGAKDSNNIHYGKYYNIGDLYVIRPLDNGNYYRYVIHSNLMHNSFIYEPNYSIMDDINANNEFNPNTDIICGICFLPSYLTPDFKGRFLYLYPIEYAYITTNILDFSFESITQNTAIPRYYPSNSTLRSGTWDAELQYGTTLFNGVQKYLNYPPININREYFESGPDTFFNINYQYTFEQTSLPYYINSSVNIGQYNFFKVWHPNTNSPYGAISDSFNGKETFYKIYKNTHHLNTYLTLQYNIIKNTGAPDGVYMPSFAELMCLFQLYDIIDNILTEIHTSIANEYSWIYWSDNDNTFYDYPYYIPAMTLSPFDSNEVNTEIYKGFPYLLKFNSEHLLELQWLSELLFIYSPQNFDITLGTWIFQL